jgi:hypothetical protein
MFGQHPRIPLSPECLVATVKQGGGSVTVCGQQYLGILLAL